MDPVWFNRPLVRCSAVHYWLACSASKENSGWDSRIRSRSVFFSQQNAVRRLDDVLTDRAGSLIIVFGTWSSLLKASPQLTFSKLSPPSTTSVVFRIRLIGQGKGTLLLSIVQTSSKMDAQRRNCGRNSSSDYCSVKIQSICLFLGIISRQQELHCRQHIGKVNQRRWFRCSPIHAA